MKKRKGQKVVMYETKTCIWCEKAREFFKEHGVKYKEIDVGKNEKEAEKMIKKSGQNGTPVIEVGKEMVIGFDEDKLRKLLKIR